MQIRSINASIPLPSGTSVFIQYYADWLQQLLSCIEFYALLWTPAVLFIGFVLYMGGMEDDLRAMLSESDEDIAAERFAAAFSLHNELIGYVCTAPKSGG